MTTTFNELKEHLTTLDEVSLLEVLEINSEELVERFEDKIESKQEQLTEEFGNAIDEETTD